MSYGKNLWKKTEGGSGGKRGHSNMAHWETTANVKNGARRARRHQDREIVEAELRDLTPAQVRDILRSSDRDIDV